MLANIIRNSKKSVGGGGGGGDPYYSAVSLLLHMDGTNGSTNFVDSGPNALTVTSSGVTTSDTGAKSGFGQAGDFPGTSSSSLTIPASSGFNFGTGNFTIEFWFNIPAGASGSPYGKTFVSNENNVWSAGAFSLYALASSTQFRPAFWINEFSGSVPILIPSSGDYRDGNWHHLAIVRNGSAFAMYIDGSLATSGTHSGNCGSSTRNLMIGDNLANNGGDRNFLGKLDDLRITKYARYKSAFTPPAAALPDIYNPNTTLPVTGAALWLDASQQNTLFTDAGTTPVTTSGQSIYQWNDLSGNNRHAVQATAGERPTWVPPASGQNGLGAVRCSTSLETRIYYSTLSSSSKTIFIVHKGVASGLMDTRLFTVNGDYKVNIGSTSTTLSFVRELIAWTNSGFSKIYNPTVFNLTYTNTPSFSAVLSKSESSGSTTIQTIFSQGGGSGYPDYLSQSGDYYEVVLFTRTLTATEISSMNNYLRSKWGTP